MPLYEYECDHHGAFTMMRPMSRAGEDGECPTCGGAGARVITAPNLFTMSPTRRDALFRNERSRHAPHVCTSGCGHGHAKSRAKQPPRGKLQSYTGPRPWVVEHR